MNTDSKSQSFPNHLNLWITAFLFIFVFALSATAQTYHYTVSDANGAPLVRFLDDGTVQMLRGQMYNNATTLQLTPNEAIPEFIIRNGDVVIARIDGISGNFYLKGGSSTAHPLQENPNAREFIIRDDQGKVVFKIDEGGNAISHDKSPCPPATPHKVTIRLSGKGGVAPFIGEQCFATGATLTVTATETEGLMSSDYKHYFTGFTVTPPYNGTQTFIYPTQSFTVTRDMTITANFRAIDLPGNLAQWALRIFGTTAYNAANFDTNGLYQTEFFDAPFPNGIPDAAEFALLQSILMDIMHPNHPAIRAKWLQARASVFADVRNGAPPGSTCEKKLKLDAKILGAMAAYRCLGYESNVASNIYFGNKRSSKFPSCTPYLIPLQTIWPNPLPPLLPAPLAPYGDLDGDGFTNAEEWGWAWAGFPDHASRVADYLLYADDPALKPAEHVDITLPHPHTSIIIMRQVGEGTIYPPVGEYDYVRFSNPNPLCPNAEDCGGYPIRIGAEAAPGWVFRRWWGEPDIEETNLTIDSTQPHTMVAEFVYRPGLAALDLLADFDYALDAWGESEIFWLLEDKNRLVRGENGALDTFAPNGIPDVFEIALLQETLKKVNLDLSRRSGVVHQEVWDMWQANLAQLTADLPTGADPRIARVIAAYMCIGDRGSIAWAQHMAQTHHSTTLDTADYEGQSVFFAFDEDADNDGATNLEEWQGSVNLLDTLEDNIPVYMNYSLDPKLEGIGFAPGGGGSVPASGGGGGCEECIPKIGVYHGIQTGGTITGPTGEFPLGEEVEVEAVPDDGWRFVRWTCADCMINGSREEKEKLFLTPPSPDVQTGNAHIIHAEFTRNIVIVPNPDPFFPFPPSYQVHFSFSGGELEPIPGSSFYRMTNDGETPFVLSATLDNDFATWAAGEDNNPTLPAGSLWGNPNYELVVRWVNDWGGPGSSTPEYVWGPSVKTYGGNWGADPFVIKKGRLVEIAVEAAKGGVVTVGRGFNNVLALAKGLFFKERDEYEFNFFMEAGAEASPGYIFNSFLPPRPNNPSYRYWLSGVTALFDKVYASELKIDVQGCGYVRVNPAKKYYTVGETVGLVAVPAGNHNCVGEDCLKAYEVESWGGNVVPLSHRAVNVVIVPGDNNVSVNFHEPTFEGDVNWAVAGNNTDDPIIYVDAKNYSGNFSGQLFIRQCVRTLFDADILGINSQSKWHNDDINSPYPTFYPHHLVTSSTRAQISDQPTFKDTSVFTRLGLGGVQDFIDRVYCVTPNGDQILLGEIKRWHIIFDADTTAHVSEGGYEQ